MNDKEYTDGIKIEKSPALKWLDNFWYHYKWTTIIVSFFVIVALVCTFQMCTKEVSDIIAVYGARNQLSVSEAQDIASAMEAAAAEDGLTVDFKYYCIMSEQEINDARAETDAEGNSIYVNTANNSSEYDAYYGYLGTGESSVLLVSPYLYNMLLSNDRLASLEDTLGYVPDNAYDAYSVRLSDTAMYDKYGVMKKMPDDTVICILRPYVAGKSSKKASYEKEKQFFGAIIKAGAENSEN